MTEAMAMAFETLAAKKRILAQAAGAALAMAACASAFAGGAAQDDGGAQVWMIHPGDAGGAGMPDGSNRAQELPKISAPKAAAPGARADTDQVAVERRALEAQQPKVFGSYGVASRQGENGWGNASSSSFGSGSMRAAKAAVASVQDKSEAVDLDGSQGAAQSAAGASGSGGAESEAQERARAAARATLANAAMAETAPRLGGRRSAPPADAAPAAQEAQGGLGSEPMSPIAAAPEAAQAYAVPAPTEAQATGYVQPQYAQQPPLPQGVAALAQAPYAQASGPQPGYAQGAAPAGGAYAQQAAYAPQAPIYGAQTTPPAPAAAGDWVSPGQEFERLAQDAQQAKLSAAAGGGNKTLVARVYQLAQDGSLSLALSETVTLAPNELARVEKMKKTPYVKSSGTHDAPSSVPEVAQSGVRAGLLWTPGRGAGAVEAAIDASALVGFDEMQAGAATRKTPRMASRTALIDFDLAAGSKPQMAWLAADGADSLSADAASRSVHWLLAVGAPDSFKGFDAKKEADAAKSGSF
jgi:hypothetical protein